MEELERLESRKKRYQGLLQSSQRQAEGPGRGQSPSSRQALQKRKAYQHKIDGIDGRLQQLRDALRSQVGQGGQ